MIDLTQITVGERIGGGSQGSVFLAGDPRGVRYTVKLVVLAENADRQAIFERAARFREDLLDRTMVPILSYGMVSATPPELARQLGKLSRDALVLVMPHVTGTSLAELLASGPLTLKETAVVLLGIASALAKLPEGLLHGDLRAPNVFLRPNGEVLLMDPDLTTEPPEGDDLRALGGMALVLLNAALPDDNAQAVAYLRTLAADVAGQGMPRGSEMEAHEAQHRLGIIAESLGAPREHPEAVLLKRLKAFEARPMPPKGGRMEGAGRDELEESWWRENRLKALIGLGVVVVLGGIALAVGNTMGHSAGPPAPSVAEPGPRAADDGLYDHTGKVSYPETVHVLGPHEHLAETDGMLEAEFEYPIERLALLSSRHEVLWEIRRPDAGGQVILDVKPARYLVEQDRDRGGGDVQRDVQPVRIDRDHPWRLATTKEIVNSPHRPGWDSDAEPQPPPEP